MPSHPQLHREGRRAQASGKGQVFQNKTRNVTFKLQKRRGCATYLGNGNAVVKLLCTLTQGQKWKSSSDLGSELGENARFEAGTVDLSNGCYNYL